MFYVICHTSRWNISKTIWATAVKFCILIHITISDNMSDCFFNNRFIFQNMVLSILMTPKNERIFLVKIIYVNNSNFTKDINKSFWHVVETTNYYILVKLQDVVTNRFGDICLGINLYKIQDGSCHLGILNIVFFIPCDFK